jgi:hypothetical protein
MKNTIMINRRAHKLIAFIGTICQSEVYEREHKYDF